MIYSNDPSQIKPEFDVELLYNKAVVRAQVGVPVNGATRHIDFQKNPVEIVLPQNNSKGKSAGGIRYIRRETAKRIKLLCHGCRKGFLISH